MTLKEQILEYLEVNGDQFTPMKITTGICGDYNDIRKALFNLKEDGFVIYNNVTNTYLRAMDKEYTEGTELDKSKGDWIDEAARTLTPEQFRGAMLFKIGEHLHGIDKKDEIGQEVIRVAYYSCRWEEYETALLKK